jgi:TRAP-type C4-dicarboxylate transport system permease small subunit
MKYENRMLPGEGKSMLAIIAVAAAMIIFAYLITGGWG